MKQGGKERRRVASLCAVAESLCSVEDAQDLNCIAVHAVNGNVRNFAEHELSSPMPSTGAPHFREIAQRSDASETETATRRAVSGLLCS